MGDCGGESEECSICYTDCGEGKVITTLPGCGHQFHYECFELWSKMQCTCPSCGVVLRKALIEHFHGEYKLPNRIQKKIKTADREIMNDIITNVGAAKSDNKEPLAAEDVEQC